MCGNGLLHMHYGVFLPQVCGGGTLLVVMNLHILTVMANNVFGGDLVAHLGQSLSLISGNGHSGAIVE